MTPATEPFGARLRRLRETAGLTREVLAERAGLSANAIAALERGERKHPYPIPFLPWPMLLDWAVPSGMRFARR